ncbi:MAG: hypothetical protein JJ978_16840 [Roseivirga sp.]|uniref:hypothetical protein n=1 Tax=Roseivirga sp. TaxID=1964215 RepID=UPI001B087A76|nr:hypothetical protein [Roseivirga sp.]MBO6497234.1 hypothetical protein [Roseivirga sp.]
MIHNDIIPLKFNFFSLAFTPYNEKKHLTSKRIIRNVLNHIRSERENKRLVMFDKHAKRTDELPRELFMYRIKFLPKEERVVCSLALLRKGALPKLKPKDGISLIPLSEVTKADIAEETRFVIDYSQHVPIVCIQFNYHGPRISDIEYYLRQVSQHKLRESKKCDVNILMDNNLDDTIQNFKNVLKFDVKFEPKSLNYLDSTLNKNYFSSMQTFGNKIKPKHLKVEALFQTPGVKTTSSQINNQGNKMFGDFLDSFKNRPYNIECFEHFEVKYEDTDGIEQTFNLLKQKSEIPLTVSLDTYRKTMKLYEELKPELDKFLDERYSSQ